jgi:glycosyltransferase involved in cell wall biosynthesis
LEQGQPLVSIGLPTYNGGRYLAQSLEALLKQDYPNWELLISDNCSTDGTGDIARAYAARSDRVRYVRHETNLGARGNFNFVLREARGAYFMWAADHDLWEPTFISRCVEALEADPTAMLAYSQCLMIDEDGAPIEKIDDGFDFASPSALYRYKHILWYNIGSKIYGLARREPLAATGGFADVIAPDRLILAQLTLQGPFERVEGYLYVGRRNRPPETLGERIMRTVVALNPSRADERRVVDGPLLYLALRDLFMKALQDSTLTFIDKLDARVATLAAFHLKYHVASNLIRVLWGGSRALRQKRRIERWWGRE